ncbi:hypothetical protein [Brumimicrobium glaciale]|nr:hypothetical protein [Brumimicrobium glaciale]
MKKESLFTIPIEIDLRFSGSSLTPTNVLEFKSKQRDINYILNIPKDKIILRKIMEVWIEMLEIRANENIDLKIEERPSFLFFKNYFDTYQPKTVMERLELEIKSLNEHQKEYFSKPPLYTTFPWVDQSPDEEYNMYLGFMKKEFEEHHGKAYIAEDGWKGFGPASNRLIEMEYNRIINIYESILKHGYIEKFGFPFIEIYIKDNEYKVTLEGAWHRSAILFAIETDSIPTVLNTNTNIINSKDVENWPQVLSKVYSKEQALEIFNDTFSSSLK